MDFVNFLISFQFPDLLIWLLIIVGMTIEGDITLIFSITAIHAGHIDLTSALIPILGGVTLRSFIAYKLGIYFKNRKKTNSENGTQLENAVMVHKRLGEIAKKNPFLSVFLSKFAYGIIGISLFIPAYLSYKGIKPMKYVLVDATASLIWLVIISGLVYLIGFTFTDVIKRIAGIVIIVVAVILIIRSLQEVRAIRHSIFEK